MSAFHSARPAVRRTASVVQTRAASSAHPVPPVPWASKTHTKKAPKIPNPLPALFPQKVVLSDGSSFMQWTTAPTPQINRLTRDITNNQLWAPGMEAASRDGIMEGRIGKFHRRFALNNADPEKDSKVEDGDSPAEGRAKEKQSFQDSDLAWMSEGAKAEKISARMKQRVSAKQKRGKK